MKAVAVEVAVAEMVEVEVRSRKNLAFLCDALASLLGSASTAISLTERLKKMPLAKKTWKKMIFSRFQPYGGRPVQFMHLCNCYGNGFSTKLK